MNYKPICDSCLLFKDGTCTRHPEGYPTDPEILKRGGGMCSDYKLKPKPVDVWNCSRCGEEFCQPEGVKPVICPNPNCKKRLWLRKIPKIVLEERAEMEALEKIPPEELEETTREMGPEDLKDVLGLTIKHDDTNKLIHFLAGVLTYTDDSQVSISNKGPSSIGKSYLPIEIATLYFPKSDVQMIGYASPTSFFHETGEWDDELRGYRVNLRQKLLIFLDQPHDALLQRLRPLISHDQKELVMKITDRKEKMGMRTKSVIIKGFPTVLFCTGSLNVDEQEATRNFLLSPETTAEKIRESIYLQAVRKGNPIEYAKMIKGDTGRERLRKRVLLIKTAKIDTIVTENSEKIADRFIQQFPKMKPRHSRDLGRLISLAQGFALLNFWHRKRNGGTLFVDPKDIDNAFELYSGISETQELGIAPYVLRVFREVIEPLGKEKYGGEGMKIKEITKRHFETYGRTTSQQTFQRDFMPLLENAGLIYEEPDPNDRRVKQYFLTSRH